MAMKNFPGRVEKFEIQAYKRPKNFGELADTHVPFTGSPRKHPYDPEKVILVADPYSSNTFFYEFRKEDVSFVEELPNLVNLEGEAVAMARIWVEKGRVGIRSTPFVVEDTWKRKR